MASSPSSAPIFRLVLTLLLAAGIYLSFAATTELVDRDEPRFARCSIEMQETGKYLVPTFNGAIRPDKPVLIYWLMAVSEAVVGRNELAFRLPSILGTLIAALFTFATARRLFDARVGALAAAIWLGAVTPFYIGTVATADGIMLAWTTAGLWLLARHLSGLRAGWHLPAAALIAGGGLLTKGPVAIAVPLLGAIGAWYFARRAGLAWPRGTARGLTIASLGGLALFLAWGIPANIASNNVLLEMGIGRHVLGRMVEAQEGHGGAGILEWVLFLPLHIPLVLIGFFPWTGFLLPALRARSEQDRLARAILLGWAVPTFLLMSAVVTKLPHYTLPIFPALAILTARYLTREVSVPARWIGWGKGVAIAAASLVAIALITIAVLLGDVRGLIGAGLAALLIAKATVEVVRGLGSGSFQRATRWTGATAFGVGLCLVALISPVVEDQCKASDEVAAAIIAQGARDLTVCTWGYGEPSVAYYLGQAPGSSTPGMRELAPTIAEWARLPGAGVLVTSLRKLGQENLRPEDVPAEVILRREVINTASSMRRTDLVVFLRR